MSANFEWRVAALVLLALAGLRDGTRAADAPARWEPAGAIPVWIEASNTPLHAELVRRVLRTWSEAANGALSFREVTEFPNRGIRVRFAAGEERYGEAYPETDRKTGRIVRADVILSAVDSPGDALHKQIVLYLTALHEIGHALGLEHTDDFDAIMYRFRRPLDPDRYFLRYRKSLRAPHEIGGPGATGLFEADLKALRRLYAP